MTPQPSEVPVFVLCGGQGSRLKEETVRIPKPMVPIGHRPILWHIMKTYACHGFKRFVLCLGYKAEVIKSYFLNTRREQRFYRRAEDQRRAGQSIDHDQDWKVSLAYTGEMTMTGARVARAAEKYLGSCEHFAVTYGDG